MVDEHVKGSQHHTLNLDGLEPAPYQALAANDGDSAQWSAAKDAGSVALQAGRVAAFTVAGGQGTRLGYNGPKGTLPILLSQGRHSFKSSLKKLPALANVMV